MKIKMVEKLPSEECVRQDSYIDLEVGDTFTFSNDSQQHVRIKTKDGHFVPWTSEHFVNKALGVDWTDRDVLHLKVELYARPVR